MTGSLRHARISGFDMAVVALLCFDGYMFALALMGRKPRTRAAVRSRGNPFFVIAIPARNRAEAVSAAVLRVLGVGYNRLLVVDCGRGAVAGAVRSAAAGDPRVIAEPLPGGSRADALNRAFAIASVLIYSHDVRVEGVSAAGTVLGVLEPGAWLDADALGAVAQQFDRVHCGAAQAHVRVLGARSSVSAALEDLEAAAFHVLAQTARNRAGTAQLMRTGAFFRLAAFASSAIGRGGGQVTMSFRSRSG